MRISKSALGRVLADPHIAGSVVSGPVGSGRRALVEAELGQLAEPPQLIRVNGSNFGTKVPLGALSFLLAQIDVGEYPTPHEMIHGLGRVLCTGQRPSIVMLGRPELIDEQSSSLLAQLAAMGKIKLIVICDHVQDLPGDLFALYRSGRLEHLCVNRMGSTETHAFVQQELGGRVSAYNSATLCYLAGGNRSLMLKLMRSWREDGQLLQHNGTWVLKVNTLEAGPAVQSLHAAMTHGLDDGERELLGALALGGPVALDRIHRSELTSELDGLLNRGQANYLSGAVGKVGISNPLLALLVSAEYRNQAHARVVELLAKLHTDPEAAQVLAQLKSLKDLGDHASQLKVAEDFQQQGYFAERWPADPRTRVGIVEMHVRALAMLGQLSHGVEAIDLARAGLDQAIRESGPRESLDIAFQELELLSRFATLFSTEMTKETSIAGSSEALVSSSGWMSESLHLRSLSLQAASWAAQARQADAMKLVRYVDEELRNVRFSGPAISNFHSEDAADIEFQLLQAELLAGRWKLASDRAQRLADGQYINPLLISYGNIMRGILLGLGNDYEAALHLLEPSLHQMEVAGDPGTEALIGSVIAYALACSGRRAEASVLICPQYGTAGGMQVPLSFYSWAAEIFSCLALAELGSAQAARRRLASFAQLARDGQHALLEALTLGFIVRLGDRGVLPQLRSAASRCEGVVGQNLEALADAAQAMDSSRLVLALQDMVETGHLLMATPTHNEFVAALEVKDQRKLSRMVNGLKRASAPQIQRENELQLDDLEQQPVWMRELTKREAQIAKMAIAGKTNLEIAKFNGVSIRTVEGHLYQVYSKLQVRNRQELTALDRTSRRTAGLR
ncbi:LuxR C-terminal-related transcriptional regulator [Glutamicibacter sp. NPDC087673]|uniref:LuxR C-terminal-related transcriptional regulator n=1 Tax=Glutamicibacter sp. NPDC087673 TaxID=3363997 RepID=UPI00381DBC2D